MLSEKNIRRNSEFEHLERTRKILMIIVKRRETNTQ